MKCTSTAQMDRLCELIIYGGLPTGSRVIGGASEGSSDYDYVMTVPMAREMYSYLGIAFSQGCLGTYAQLFASYKYTCGGKIINLILVDEVIDLDAWRYATERMHDECPIKNAAERKKAFGSYLVSFYRKVCKDAEKVSIANEIWGGK